MSDMMNEGDRVGDSIAGKHGGPVIWAVMVQARNLNVTHGRVSSRGVL